jgi:hypothetical protein
VRSEGLPLTQVFDLAKKRQPARHVGVGASGPNQEKRKEQRRVRHGDVSIS